MGKHMQLHLDASAAKIIVERQGLSKVRHVDVNVLSLQETFARKLIPLKKVAGQDNCSDMMTKNLTSAKLDKNGRRRLPNFTCWTITLRATSSRRARRWQVGRPRATDA